MNTTTPLADPGTTIYLSPIYAARDALCEATRQEKLLNNALSIKRPGDARMAKRAIAVAQRNTSAAIGARRAELWGTAIPVPKHSTFDERFLALVVVDGECHRWTGYVRSNGYLLLSEVPVRRYALKRTGVDLPDHVNVKTTCGNPLCVNPEHLSFSSSMNDQEAA